MTSELIITADFIIEVIVQFIVCSVASIAFAVFFHPPYKHLIFSGLCGGFAWAIYMILAYFGIDAHRYSGYPASHDCAK